jgi:hypothetical protein
MKLAISSGHGLHIRGARGNPVPPQLDERDENVKVVDRVTQILNDGGVPTVKFHDDKSTTQDSNLSAITSWHNKQTRDYDVSVHFNAYDHTAHGTEVLYVTQADLAARVSLAISDAGNFTNRGAKKNGNLSFLNNTNKPAILIETCFCDNTNDSNKYRQHFEKICHAIAASIAGNALGESKPPEQPPVDVPVPPERPPVPSASMPRPTISDGDYGSNVRELQKCLKLAVDGDFGPQTAGATQGYQRSKGLAADGVCGPQTWAALVADFNLPSYPPPLPAVLRDDIVDEITTMANKHEIGDYEWNDRGVSPIGYVKGMALAYAQACVRFANNDPIVMEMAKANTHNDADDALSWYASNFNAKGMSNEESGRDTLRHLYVLLMGLGMRESSGQHCEGRDQSATNTSSTTAEAGLFQTSFNASTCCTDFLNLFDQYHAAVDDEHECAQGYLDEWKQEVDCSSSDWQGYGSGDGYEFQQMQKSCPTFAVECAAIGLRNLRQHWGPINRKEAELRAEADDMFQQVEDIVDTMDAD